MSPPELQEDAWTQVPPWQLVEQQSVPSVHAFPSVLQLETVVLTVPQVLVLQTPEQHFAFVPLQPVALSWMQLAAQLPPTQEKLQQSLASVHDLPVSAQNAAEVHLPYAHTVEQHCESPVQVSPPGWQAVEVVPQ